MANLTLLFYLKQASYSIYLTGKNIIIWQYVFICEISLRGEGTLFRCYIFKGNLIKQETGAGQTSVSEKQASNDFPLLSARDLEKFCLRERNRRRTL